VKHTSYEAHHYAVFFTGVIKSMRVTWGGHVARMGGAKNAYSIFIGKHGGKNPLGTLRSRQEDNVRMNLKETGLEVVDCIYLGGGGVLLCTR
jgi:hypothetical protein